MGALLPKTDFVAPSSESTVDCGVGSEAVLNCDRCIRESLYTTMNQKTSINNEIVIKKLTTEFFDMNTKLKQFVRDSPNSIKYYQVLCTSRSTIRMSQGSLRACQWF